MVKDIGNFIGSYMEADPKSFDGGWKVYERIRVLSRRLKTPET